MRKKSIALVGVTAVLTSWGLQSMQAAQAVQAASQVSAVQVAWANLAQGQIKITWTESSPVANTVQLNTGTIKQLGTTSAAEPNELLVNISDLGNSGDPADRASIVVTDPDGGSAASPEFDRYLPHPKDVAMTVSPEGVAKWTIYPDTSDATIPDDPLDVAGLTQYDVDLHEQGSPHTCSSVDLSDSAATTGVIPRRAKPYNVHVQPHNEWGADLNSPGPSGPVSTSALTIASPAVTQYGAVTTIAGGIAELFLTEGSQPSQCYQWTKYGPRADVILQARNTGTSPWYVVGSATTGNMGGFTFTVKNQGALEYRVFVGNLQRLGSFMYGTSTAAKLVRSTTRVVSAKFIAPVVTYGTKPQAYLWVDPAGSQQAALQFKNASGAWQGLTYKTLSSGRGIATFTFNRRGATQFRWWIPGSTTSAGLKVDPAYSGIFTLTVR
jgi:hypothetical protein